MANTPNLGLPIWAANEASPWIANGTGRRRIDAFCQPVVYCLNVALTAAPGSPAEGDTYFIGGTGSGGWAGHSNQLTVWTGSAWLYQTPKEGWLLFDNTSNTHKVVGSAGTLTTFVGGGITLLDVPYTIGACVVNNPLAANEIAFMVIFTEAVRLAINLTSISSRIKTAATSTDEITLFKRTAAGSETNIGGLTYTNASTAFAGGFDAQTDFAINDILYGQGPATPDATLKNYAIGFKGVRL